MEFIIGAIVIWIVWVLIKGKIQRDKIRETLNNIRITAVKDPKLFLQSFKQDNYDELSHMNEKELKELIGTGVYYALQLSGCNTEWMKGNLKLSILMNQTINDIYDTTSSLFLNNSNDNALTLEDQLMENLLPNELQRDMYAEARNLKFYVDLATKVRSQESTQKFQQAVMEAFETSTKTYEWLVDCNITQLNALTLLASFYLVSLSDETFRDSTSYSDIEITNTLNTFLSAMGVQDQVDISSYNKLVRIGIDWLLLHPTE